VWRKGIDRERRKVIGRIYFVTTVTNYTLKYSFLDGHYIIFHDIDTTT